MSGTTAILARAPNHNLGFELSSGDYFKWCACDDNLSSNFIGACVAALDENQEAALAYGATQCIDEQGLPIPLIGRMMPDLKGLGTVRPIQKDHYREGHLL